jgi:hypothetical protein
MRFFGELATANPLLIGYLAYIVGLLIAITAVRASEALKAPGSPRDPSRHFSGRKIL